MKKAKLPKSGTISKSIIKNEVWTNSTYIVSKLLAHLDNINWPMNVKIAKKLYTQYPNMDFWNEFRWPGNFRPDNLSPLLSEWGKSIVGKSWNIFTFIETEKIKEMVLIENTIPETKCEVKQKPKTLKDFLR